MPNGDHRAVINTSIARTLSGSEVSDIIEQADSVWNPPLAISAPLAPGVIIDSACSVALLDHEDVLQESGMFCPSESERLVNVIGAIDKQLPPR
jgi:hypothetical protein